MKRLYKITLLITMVVVTWKVWKVERKINDTQVDYSSVISSRGLDKPLANSRDFRYS
ncbi:hypothetical protein [Staphylococcus delphini]|uniref:hypothetical protein n=1 Tax=Staphylococcus delphini TaxID=53344 RepID=UPI0015CE0DBB|nr:hypothetical protein [Staphylococcus delphini]